MWGNREPSSLVYVNRPKAGGNGRIALWENHETSECDYIKGYITKKNVTLGKDWNGSYVNGNQGANRAEVLGYQDAVMDMLVLTISDNDVTKPVYIIKEKLYSYGTLSLLNSLLGGFEKRKGIDNKPYIHLVARKSGFTKDERQLFAWSLIDAGWKHDVDYFRKAGVYQPKDGKKLHPDAKEKALKAEIDKLYDDLCKLLSTMEVFDYDNALNENKARQDAEAQARLDAYNDTPPELRGDAEFCDDVPF